MRVVHLVAAGKESLRIHLAGLPKFTASEVVLFSSGRAAAQPLVEAIGSTNIPCRVLEVEANYVDSYRKASFEGAAAFTRVECVGLNMSVGPEIIRTAMEDAVRIQLYHFLHHTSTEEISAFKYFVPQSGTLITAVPIWDFATYLHNDIFEILASAKEPITLAEIFKLLTNTMGREAPKWEAFRKTFREFKRSYGGSPCFIEVVGKGPRYKINV